MKYHYRFYLVILCCQLAFYILGCGSDEKETDPVNSLPSVDSFIVPEEFKPGEVLEFKVIAHDDDGDILSFTWEVDGRILESTGASAKWTAPDDVESVKVTVHISDGIGKSVKRVKTITNKQFTSHEPVDPPDVEIDVVPDPPLDLVVPGKGAYGVKLGIPFKQVEALHGKPDGPIGADRVFTYWEPDKGFAGHVDGIGLVEDIFLSRPNRAKTAGGNGIGSTLDSVEREFGNAEEIDEDEFGGIRHWFLKHGIEFTIDEEEKVLFIFVYKPIAGAPAGVGIQNDQNADVQKDAAVELRHRRAKHSSLSGN